jgi:ribosomal protein S18 acetylase RimI-like enzyme
VITVIPATQSHYQPIWHIIAPIIRAGETYALPRDMTESEALSYWFAPTHEVFVALLDNQVAGTFYLKPNQPGGGAHVANCGFMVGTAGRGVARAMCAFALERAKARGFTAMQFNFVISSNERAVRLWQSFGFTTLARLPAAFAHPTLGYVDALLMHRTL